MKFVAIESATIGVSSVCAALSIPRASFYRYRRPRVAKAPRRPPRGRSRPRNAGNGLAVLHEPRFVDKAPAEVYATLLDAGRYLCSERTMDRLLEANDEVRDRRDILRHKNHPKPELLATRPNELWSWDITKLHGPKKWTYFYLYVVIDVFSRYAVGWMVAHAESSALATKLIEETCERQRIARDTLTIHADRGTSMKSKAVAFLLGDLGVTKSHSRPYRLQRQSVLRGSVRNAQISTRLSERFGRVQDARSHCDVFFRWYNDDHRHDGLELHTPRDVHYGLAKARTVERNLVLDLPSARIQNGFPSRSPVAKEPPTEVWINKPTAAAEDSEAAQ